MPLGAEAFLGDEKEGREEAFPVPLPPVPPCPHTTLDAGHSVSEPGPRVCPGELTLDHRGPHGTPRPPAHMAQPRRGVEDLSQENEDGEIWYFFLNRRKSNVITYIWRIP